MTQVQTLYAEHGGALLRYLRGMTHRADVAEDLLQETFVQAMRGMERLREARSPKAWLFSIARHLGINAIQRRRAVLPLPDEIGAGATPTSQRPVRSPAATEDERIDRMREAIGELPDHQREALQLRIRDDLSYDEIAEALGIPVGTVRSRLHHAIRNLREVLAESKEQT